MQFSPVSSALRHRQHSNAVDQARGQEPKEQTQRARTVAGPSLGKRLLLSATSVVALGLLAAKKGGHKQIPHQFVGLCVRNQSLFRAHVSFQNIVRARL
ncbi:MAG: hypothetical protein ACJAUP_001276 [Cellvibrionaceae bacterium]|jgi:hypothetical protein